MLFQSWGLVLDSSDVDHPLVPIGVTGELVIRGIIVGWGYLTCVCRDDNTKD